MLTPDDILAGRLAEGHVVVYDDDQYYMGGVHRREAACRQGRKVTFVTPGLEVSSWTVMTDEQAGCRPALMQAGVANHLTRKLAGWDGDHATLASIYDGRGSIGRSGDAGRGDVAAPRMTASIAR